MRTAERWLAAAVLAAMSAGALADGVKYRNLTAGGPLRPGIYGRIEVHGKPPPLIYPKPVIGSQELVAQGTPPIYLYVPPGQVRKWPRNCAKWKACERPVLFVRVDDSPSRLGAWRRLKERYALHGSAD